MHRTDADANIGGLFSEGDPATGTPGTKIGADWLNAVQEELVAVLTAAGIPPDKANNAQLAAALDALIRGLKAGALLRVGTSSAHDLELVRAGVTMLALTASALDAKSKQLNNVASLRLVPGAVGGSAAVEGDVWHDNVSNALRARLAGVAEILATRGWAEASLQFNAPTPTTATLAANWTGNATDGVPKYWKDRDGIVHLSGSAIAGTGAQSTIMILPAGMRPGGSNYRTFSIFNTNASAAVALRVSGGGIVHLNSAPTAGHHFWLDGVSFLAEG